MAIIRRIWRLVASFLFIFILVAGYINPYIALLAILCMTIPLLLCLLGKGRFWCGNLCPRGSFFDIIFGSFCSKNKMPSFLTGFPMRLAVLFFMFSALGIQIYNSDGTLLSIAHIFYQIVLITTVVGLFLGLIFNKKGWCRICPIGTLSHLIIKAVGTNNALYIDHCYGRCHRCQDACPMHLPIKKYQGGYMNHPDCVRCKTCLSTCPSHRIHSGK